MSGQDETIGTLIASAARDLAAAGIEGAQREARIMLAHCLGLHPASLRLRERAAPVEPRQAASFRADVARRTAREPLAHITGSQGFWTLDLLVSDATLIPRADSETLIEALLALRPDRDAALRVLDLGTGTGCLLLASLAEYRRAWGVGIDLSPLACDLAATNARLNGLAGRSAFLCGSWSDAVAPPDAARFDLVLSNPPYIPSGEVARLMPEVARFEPRRALDGGTDGLGAYRSILSRLAALLAPDGIAILELGAGQLEQVRAIVVQAGLEFVSVHADLGAIERAITLRLPRDGQKIFGRGASGG